MKGFKKLLTGILAASMIMGASLTAFAAEDTTATASITIQNDLQDGKDGVKKIDYTYYQFLKAEVLSLSNSGDHNADQSGEVVYYVESSELARKLEATGCFAATKATGADRWYITAVEGKTGEDIVAALSNMTDSAIATGHFSTTEGQHSAHADLEAGYYLFISSLGTKAAVQTVGNVTIKEKNEDTTVTKTENKEIDSMYDNVAPVEYTISINVPESPANDKITVVDLATKGLTFVGTATASNGKTYTWSAPVDEEVTVNDAKVIKNKYTIDIPAGDVLAAAGSTLTLTYKAVINKDAVVFVPEKNSAYIIYDNNASAETVPVEVKTLGIKIIKYTLKDNKEVRLTGAEFKLWADAAKEKQIQVVKVSDGNYRVADSNDSTEVLAETIVVDENGEAVIAGLDGKDYYLEEVVAPAGYTMLDHLETVTVDRTATEIIEVPVLNQTGATLPSTGGMGTRIFYVIGGILIAAGVAYFILRRKANA
jgi:fimbrial isopeptide formation D2 family protein/LPXTG-motif cell wall-anchored protein